MLIYWSVFAFFLGLIFGSFSNVLIDRTQRREGLLGRSHCDDCGYILRWFDNLPILSFLLLGGRCRKCKNKLSWQYPLVEFLFGVTFLTTFLIWYFFRQVGVIELSFYFLMSFLLLVILIWDFKYMIIPDFLVVIGFISTLIYRFQFNLTSGLLGAVVVGGFFAIMFYGSRGKWIGGGDVKLGFWLGLLVGLKMAYFFLTIAYVLGAVYALFLVFLNKKGMKSQVPFGPFLVIAGYIVFFFGEKLLYFYKGLI